MCLCRRRKTMDTTNQPAGWRWRRFRPRHLVLRNPLAILPLINLGLLILLFMVMGLAFVLQPGIVVQLPVAEFVAGAPYGARVVTLTRDGLAFFNDDRIPLESLGAALHQAGRRDAALILTVQADARVPYGDIVRVMNMATAAGIRQINLAIRPSFGEASLP